VVYDPSLGYDPNPYGGGGYDPFQGTATGYNNQYAQQQTAQATQQATQAYQMAMSQNQSDTLAFNKAQQAFTDAMSLGSAYGYSMGGNPYNFGSQMLPPAGTPLQATMNTLGSGGAIPGQTGFNTGTTASYQGQLAQQAATAAGLTGFYNAPKTSGYSPGTFVRIDPSTYDAKFGTQLDYVLPSGQLQRVSTTQASQMGWNGNLSDLSTLPFSQAAQLEFAPPQYLPQQTLQGQQAYQSMNASAQQQALAASQATGMYAAPAAIQAPGTNLQGGKFQDLDQGTQQAYFYSNGGDWTAAMNKWVADSNNALKQATVNAGGTWNPGQPGQPGGTGTPAETMAAQQQYFNQAQNLAQTYGQYYAPGAPGQAAQPGVNAPQAGQTTQSYQQFQQQSAQSYLDLLSRLQGPADYGSYLRTLGATPSGIQGLVGAAAGQYVPGGGATGVAPQAQTLQNLVGAATGYAGGGAGANAATTGQTQQLGTGTGGTASPGGQNYQDFLATAQGLPPPSQIAPQSFNAMMPSQQQMLGSMYGSMGWAPGDINKMFQSSLPKYAAGSSAGNFRLV
jgi:hypothetical protein